MAKQKQTVIRNREQQLSWFDKLTPLKKDVVCIAVMFGLILVLFNGIIFGNMIFSESGDTASPVAWAKAGSHIEETEHVDPLWIPYVFSGMPGFGSLSYSPHNVNYVQTLLYLPGRWLMLNADMGWLVWQFFLAGVFMFLLVRGMKFSQLPSLLAALIFMLNPYAISLAQAGQGSKLIALSYIPLLFLLTYRLFQERTILNFALLCAAVGTMLLTYHVQMAFYGFLMVGCYVLYQIVMDLKNQPAVSAKNAALFVLALVVGFAISSYVYLSVQEYAQYSIRGGGAAGVSGGLDYDYATGWSFHPFETMNYLIPSFFGFSSDYVTELQGQQQALPLYWGWMPFTTSTVYIGILPIILGIVTFVYRRNRLTIFLMAMSILILLISFGNHLPIVFDLLFRYLPYFNRFRAPSMILHLMPITFGILAAYGVNFLIELPDLGKELNIVGFKRRLKVILGVLGGLLLLGLIARGSIYSFLSSFMFVKEGDIQQYGQQAVDMLKEKRFDVLFNDFVKSVVFAAAILGLILAYSNKKIQRSTFVLGLIVVLVIDLYIIDTKYIEPKPQTAIEQTFVPDVATSFLKNDTSFYRIFPIGSQLFRDYAYMYMYHLIPSIGGYSPAKLKIYQEMIDSTGLLPPRFPLNMNVLNMLSTKYIVSPGRLPETNLQIVQADQSKGFLTYLNPAYFPHAWFVDSIIVAENKHGVFQILNSSLFDARHEAILEKRPPVPVTKSDSTHVLVTEYLAHTIKFDVFTATASLLVLSEVYYPAGWKAYVDGTETEIYKTNYVLRSIVVPPGNHSIEFSFSPAAYRIGYTATQAAWGVTAVLVLIGMYQIPEVRKRLGRKPQES